MLRRAIGRKLRRIADLLDPPTPVTAFNRRKTDSVRPIEEQLESLRQMAEARSVMQMFEDRAALILHKQQQEAQQH